jgi:hypothetical protein
MKKGYLLHTEWNDGDSDKLLFGQCPELVRVDLCTAWRPMSSVFNLVPRVMHFPDVKAREIHVAGRDLHFVCGASSTEYVDHFGFKTNSRKHVCMYPEGLLGAGIQPATIIVIQDLFRCHGHRHTWISLRSVHNSFRLYLSLA